MNKHIGILAAVAALSITHTQATPTVDVEVTHFLFDGVDSLNLTVFPHESGRLYIDTILLGTGLTGINSTIDSTSLDTSQIPFFMSIGAHQVEFDGDIGGLFLGDYTIDRWPDGLVPPIGAPDKGNTDGLLLLGFVGSVLLRRRLN